MFLMPGARLGSYDIAAPLGAGGPAFALTATQGELRRGLAEAQRERRC